MGDLDHETLSQLAILLQANGAERSRSAVVGELPDEALCDAFRTLSDSRTLIDTVWLPLIENEVKRRKLIQIQ